VLATRNMSLVLRFRSKYFIFNIILGKGQLLKVELVSS
jgi:hypothetical protein